MKYYESLAVEYCSNKFPKSDQWDKQIIAKDAYLAACHDILNLLTKEVELNISHQLFKSKE